MRVTIQHQIEKTFHTFNVKNADKLNKEEVKHICHKMSVEKLFINGKFYQKAS
jgi:hypothetical protein